MTLNFSRLTGAVAALVIGSSCGRWPGIDDFPHGQHPGGGPDGSGGEACWAGRLPKVEARRPARRALESCDAVQGGGVAWVEPPLPMETGGDASGLFVGRWLACGQGGLGLGAHEGIEFGANGRWRLLARDATGAVVPVPESTADSRGRYFALGRGQFELKGEGIEGRTTIFYAFDEEKDLVRFDPISGPAGTGPAIYARGEPSPLNGRDFGPSTSDGRCSMVGTWDLAGTDQSPPATFSFDGDGNFVGGPPGVNLCRAHTMYGTYRVTPGLFQLTSNVGMGLCQWWFDAAYPATFDADCRQVTLEQRFDNCTGGRGYFNGVTVMTRRR